MLTLPNKKTKKATVYWAYNNSHMTALSVGGYPPEFLSQAIRKDLEFIDDKEYLSCPALLKGLSNVIVLRAAYDVELVFSKEKKCWDAYNINKKSRTELPISKNSINHIQLHELFGFNFFSDTPDTIFEITPPYFHPNAHPGISGSFDIGNWYRTIGGTILKKDTKPFFIRRGDPIFYLRSNRPFKLKRFQRTEKMSNLERECLVFKDFIPIKPLSYLYENFNRNKMRNRILEEIKNNLI